MKRIIVTAALMIGTYCIKAQTSVSEKDQKFIKCAAEGSMMEVRLGELAQANALSPEVKKLGQQMMDDHSKANEELKALAAKKNLPAPSTVLNDKGQKMYEKLSKKSGKDFDKAYTKCMVKDHKKDISEFKKEADKGEDPEIKAWASNTLPTLEHHEKMSEETCKVVKGEK